MKTKTLLSSKILENPHVGETRLQSRSATRAHKYLGLQNRVSVGNGFTILRAKKIVQVIQIPIVL